MEMESSMSLVNYVPSFARGQNLLLLHNDKSSLNNISSQLKQFSFKVTPVSNVSTATYMIGNFEGCRFKIVMAKIDMPGLNVSSLIHLLKQKNIQLIFICSEGSSINAATWERLAESPCYLLEEPIEAKDLKYLWHNIYQTKTGSVTKTGGNKAHEANGKKNGDVSGSFDNNDHIAEEGEARRVDRSGSAKKNRYTLWTPELHKLFEKTVFMLGNEDAHPKDVLIYMNVPGITKDQVKSHLQKYKSQLKLKKAKSSALTLGSSTTRNRSSMFEGPSYQEEFAPSHPAPTTSMNMNQEQNQNQMSYVDATQTQQVSDTNKRLEIQARFVPSHPAPTTSLNMNQEQNQNKMSSADAAQTQQELDTRKQLETQGSTSITHEVPTGMANNESQSLDSIRGNLMPKASTVETHLKQNVSPTQRYKSQLKHKKARSSYVSSGSSMPCFTSRNMSSMFQGPSYQGFAPSHPAPTTSLNMNQEKNQNKMSSADRPKTQQGSGTSKQLVIGGSSSSNMSSMFEGPSYQGFAPSHPAPTPSLNMNQEQNQNKMSSTDAAKTQQESNTRIQLEIEGNSSRNMSSMFKGSSYQAFAPSNPAPTTFLKLNYEKILKTLNSANSTKTQQASDTSKQLEIQGNSSKNMSSMFEGPSYRGFAPSHLAPTASLNMNQDQNQNRMSSADAAKTQQESESSKQLEIQDNSYSSSNMSSMFEGPSYQAGFAPRHPYNEQNQNKMTSVGAAHTQLEPDTSKQLEIQGNICRNMSSMFEGSSYQAGFAPRHPAPITSLNMSQEQNQNQMSSADAAQTQQEVDTSKQLETQGSTSITHEFPTGLASNESQSLDSIPGNLMPEASPVETQPEEDMDGFLERMREDNFFADDMNIDYDYEFNAMLRMLPESSGQFPGHEF